MSSIAVEAQFIARKAAEPVRAGETVKAQLRRAVAVLRLPEWRVRAAWYGEAGSWSAAALEDMRARHRALTEKSHAKQVSDAATQIARLEALAGRLAANDTEFFAPDIAAARSQIERLRRLIDRGV